MRLCFCVWQLICLRLSNTVQYIRPHQFLEQLVMVCLCALYAVRVCSWPLLQARMCSVLPMSASRCLSVFIRRRRGFHLALFWLALADEAR